MHFPDVHCYENAGVSSPGPSNLCVRVEEGRKYSCSLEILSYR